MSLIAQNVDHWFPFGNQVSQMFLIDLIDSETLMITNVLSRSSSSSSLVLHHLNMLTVNRRVMNCYCILDI